ncbi:MAG: hypothetical protein HC840_02960 [Leptolyngbyaceae cyanobacterium RM2_2_4]|nr:hypothetical protein [Leptolyngbyaceae cyanobacterium SM1_4_3]NJN91808.1 hypothetical protein [Leptolyngbyaceae cyanobacterium SL_5_14]NJO48602.1 hypothetical protein [Leptolyngbyaceae cyanobacterium RM2_2_4]
MRRMFELLKQVFPVFLAGVLFLTASFGVFGGEAIADIEKPQATTYDRGNYNNEISEPGTREQFNYGGRNNRPDAALENSPQVERAQDGLKGVADNVREKLNLDQPIYPGTKEFIDDVKNKVEETVEGAERAVER